MRSIKFTEEELEFLVGQYKLELVEAEKYTEEIKNILLGSNENLKSLFSYIFHEHKDRYS